MVRYSVTCRQKHHNNARAFTHLSFWQEAKHFHTNPSVLDWCLGLELPFIWSPQHLLPRASLCWQLVQSSTGYKSGGKSSLFYNGQLVCSSTFFSSFIKLMSPLYGRRTVVLRIRVFWFWLYTYFWQCVLYFCVWRRKWQPTPVFWPGEFHGQRSLVGYSPWGCRVGHHWTTNTFTFIF